MSDKPTIHQLANAVELAAVNHLGHVRNLAGLVEKGKRPKAELDLARLSLPGLQAAALLLRFLEKQEKAVQRLREAGMVG